MCPTRSRCGRHWDGSRVTPRRHRALAIARDSPSRLLRLAQRDTCRACGNAIDWHATPGHRPVALHPAELPASHIPKANRWHVSSGVAYAGADATPWCRITHRSICPGEAEPPHLPTGMTALRRHLALNTRRLIEAGAFTPGDPSQTAPHHTDPCRPTRPVVQILYIRYLAARPVEQIRCVAQTTRRTRCVHPILAPGTTPGRWTLMPPAPNHGRPQQLALPASDIAVYDLARLSYQEQIRWRTQRCPTHAATTAAPDLALADWEPFDPFLHHAFAATRLPTSTQH